MSRRISNISYIYLPTSDFFHPFTLKLIENKGIEGLGYYFLILLAVYNEKSKTLPVPGMLKLVKDFKLNPQKLQDYLNYFIETDRFDINEYGELVSIEVEDLLEKFRARRQFKAKTKSQSFALAKYINSAEIDLKNKEIALTRANEFTENISLSDISRILEAFDGDFTNYFYNYPEDFKLTKGLRTLFQLKNEYTKLYERVITSLSNLKGHVIPSLLNEILSYEKLTSKEKKLISLIENQSFNEMYPQQEKETK